MKVVEVALVTADWETPDPSAPKLPAWPQWLIEEVFEKRNGWSVASYWDSCSLGFRRLKFDVLDLGVLKGTQGGDRRDIHSTATDQAREKGLPVDKYDHVVYLVNPAKNDAGAIGLKGGAILDNAADHEFFAHELGHILGFDHPYGWDNRIAVEYEDPYCLMGWTGPNSSLIAPSTDDKVRLFLPERGKLAPDQPDFWISGRMPAAATLAHFWSDFMQSHRVVTPSDPADDEHTLTALSEHEMGGPVLLRIPDGNANYFVEYRNNTRWDRGLAGPVVLIHSQGIPLNHDGSPLHRGSDRVWFEYAIHSPFFDAWSVRPDLGVEVIQVGADSRTIKVRVTRPSRVRSATLVEREGRWRHTEEDSDHGTVLLNSENDPNLCSSEGKFYQATVKTFGELIDLNLVLERFEDPFVEVWRINDVPLPAASGIVTPIVSATRRVLRVASSSSGFVSGVASETRPTKAPIEYEADSSGIRLRTLPKIGAYTLNVECVVRERAFLGVEPSSFRTATATVSVNGDRIQFDEQYVRDAESCWWRRTRVPELVKRWPRKGPPLPPWVDPRDPIGIRRLVRRVQNLDRELATREPGEH